MGAFCDDDDLTFSSNNSFAYAQDLRLSKHVHDNVHGNIYLDPVAFSYVPILCLSSLLCLLIIRICSRMELGCYQRSSTFLERFPQIQ